MYVKVSVDAAAKRDPKGLYKKAMAGEIKNFTGVDDPYEAPVNAEIVFETERVSSEDAAQQMMNYLDQKGYLSA